MGRTPLRVLAVLMLPACSSGGDDDPGLPLPPAPRIVTVTLSADRDTTLYETMAGTLSNGAGQFLFSGRIMGPDRRRALVKFDVAGALPAGSTIQEAALTLYMDRTLSSNDPTSVHRALADWGEGASDAVDPEGMGAAPAAGDATWIHRFFDAGGTSLWTTSGGDFAPAARATVVVDGEAAYVWSSTPGMVSDVQAWLNVPSSNFGWIVVGNETKAQSAKRFASRENTTASRRPSLRVVYREP